MPLPPKAWPRQTTSLCKEILEQQAGLQLILEVCLIKDTQQKLIEILLPKIRERTNSIKELAKLVLAHIPKRTGRKPKWVEVAEETVALSSKILNCAALIQNEVGNWDIINSLLQISLEANQEIKRQMEIIPFEQGVFTL